MAPTHEPLSARQIKTALAGLPAWSGDRSGLKRTFEFVDFKTAMKFMRAAAPSIDAANHHPEWTNVYNRVSVTLRTHDADDLVTDLDVKIARLLSRVAKKHHAKAGSLSA